MKFYTAAAVLGLAATVSAQASCLSVALKVPSCATSCLASAGQKVGCGLTEFKCQCDSPHSASIAELAAPCVLKACGDKAADVQASAAAVCSCAEGGSGGSGSKPTSAPAQTTGGSQPTGGAGSSAAGGSYPASGAGSSSAAATGTGAATGSAGAPISTGGAAMVAGSVAGVMGGLFAVVAAL